MFKYCFGEIKGRQPVQKGYELPSRGLVKYYYSIGVDYAVWWKEVYLVFHFPSCAANKACLNISSLRLMVA